MVKHFLIISLVLALAAQKPVKKPDVHADFQFGSYPWSRQAETLMKDDLTREIMVAYSQGWSIDKMAKTLKVSASDVSKISDKLEDERLAGRRDSTIRCRSCPSFASASSIGCEIRSGGTPRNSPS